ncbi:pseudouridine synthase deg1 [Didymosphaeria variabile]|uniref:Pseudouridine synthase deg1 n=1 Tax=Didymosphaeria variabile TaxID=1932322 RepID=A0A9W9C988_9PLEO|nr:pseudouridine synthase deg1 [Didymosphaeria variabile]KAJ4350479.1 pseudouridine synthase deg1 [Didymosphaeria variabile]
MRGIVPHLPVHSFPEFEHQLHRLFCTRRSFHKLSRVPRREQILRTQLGARSTMSPGYEQWTHEQLVARIKELESQIIPNDKVSASKLAEPNAATFRHFPIPSPGDADTQIPYRKPAKQQPKAFDASRYSTRLIALKFAYLGQKYNGLEHHANNTTPLPTIEEELWKALMKTRLISPTPKDDKEEETFKRLDRKQFEKWDRDGADVNWEGCEYSKCGRTDRGVSAFGQVIGVRVRSNRPRPKPAVALEQDAAEDAMQEMEIAAAVENEESTKPFDDRRDELAYIQLLNRVLPPDIRIYAWCPEPPPNFSARFSCKERRYKYFFTNPCFAPVPGTSGVYSPLLDTTNTSPPMREGWLDIAAMRQACKNLEGLHDFRNFCKIDPSKQITNFNRRIFRASIEEVSPLSVPSFLSHIAIQNPASGQEPKMYAFVLHGSAFLWHQVRSIVAILFLIGQRLEAPELITHLLDIVANPTRPKYEMASDAPLVLWDCIFPYEHEVQSSEEREHGYEDRLQWVYVGDEGGIEPKSLGKAKAGGGPSSMGRGKWGRGGVMDDVWELWRGNKIDETLSALLLDAVAGQGESTLDREGSGDGNGMPKAGPRVFDGGDVGRAKGNYMPVLERERQEPVEVVNERYARKKGLDPNARKPKEEDADE